METDFPNAFLKELQFFKQIASSAPFCIQENKQKGFLHTSQPQQFDALCTKWQELLDFAKKSPQAYGAPELLVSLGELAKEVGALGGGPSDIAEIHCTILNEQAQRIDVTDAKEWQHLTNVGQKMVFEFLVLLTLYYEKNPCISSFSIPQSLTLSRRMHEALENSTIRILLVEDNQEDAELFQANLKKNSIDEFVCIHVTNLQEALLELQQDEYSVIVTDLSLPDSEKEQSFDEIVQVSHGIPVIVMTGFDDEELAISLVRRGAQDYLVKGQMNSRSLVRTIRLAVERKIILDELAYAREEANQAAKAKSDFLANMSHEIRTPLNAILGMAQIFQEAPLDTEHQRYAKTLHRAGESLLALVNEILDLSKIESGKLEMEQISFNPFQIVEDAIEISTLRAKDKGLQLYAQISPEIPPALIGDANRFRQVLVNLLGNAIKFTQCGEIRLEVMQQPATNHSCTLQVAVKDTGIGIAEEKLSQIFESFSQAHGNQQLYGGTGLGLAISKRLIEKMGGKIWCESKLGYGSTFYFTVSCPIDSKQSLSPEMSSEFLLNSRALIVDADTQDSESLAQILSAWGMHVRTATNSDEGLGELMRAIQSGSQFDLVLVNCRLPKEGGFKFVEFIQEFPKFHGKLMMLLPVDHYKDDPALCRKMGIPHFMIKPIKKLDLLETIRDLFHLEQGTANSAQTSAAENPFTLQALKILLVEDLPDNQFVVKIFLKKHPYTVDVAENGKLALEKVMAEKYDLILMDMRMPVMDGYTATRGIRAWEKQQNVSETPIVALTASTLRGEAYKAIQAGCNAHLQKPVIKSLLLSTITKYTTTSQSSGKPLERKIELSIDPDIQDLIPQYLERRNADVQTLQQALASQDFEAVRTIGHNLKGSGEYYGFAGLSELGRNIELAAKQSDAKQAAILLKQLQEYLQEAEKTVIC